MPLTNDQIAAIQLNLCMSDKVKTKLLRDWDTLTLKQQEAALRLIGIAKHMQNAVIAKVVEKRPEFEQEYAAAIEEGLQGVGAQREKDQEAADRAAVVQYTKDINHAF